MTEMNDDLLKLKNRIEKSMYRIFISESDEDNDRAWIVERITDDRLKKLVPRLSVSSLHILDVIHRHDGIKGVDIAREMDITKGTVSKITRKLLEQGLIRKTQLPDNLKEIYFSVTPLGAELAELHRLFHREQDQKAMELLASFDLASLEIVANFLEKLARLRQL
ncbi:MarR family transcriptional regulator [Paenibacillus doosanensis]|uniref:MarR family transcriptional regulator n=1 Tax=Paenibacillus doosanensis TaxID=1229154 RepID=UPI00218053E2|nr:MarR family transcriptional regulator [Paenibacillus doosanensis]MCS7461277.1 MarR family transcriptional regulator [Paenibacillus doosanensis]